MRFIKYYIFFIFFILDFLNIILLNINYIIKILSKVYPKDRI